MTLLSLARTIKEGFVNFGRNGWLSIATISVIVLALFVVSFVFFVVLVGDQLITQLQDKINVSVYFDVGIEEGRILEIKNEIGNYQEIKNADYISRDQALINFKESNKDNPVVLQSLEVVEGNPFMASVVIKAQNPEQYGDITSLIEQNYREEVSRINYGKNKQVIDKLNNIIRSVKNFGLGIGLLFVLVSILITFNTIRITLYNHRQEIEIKRLVGAANWYIRLPYVLEGIIYSVIASIISIGILYAAIYFTTPMTSKVLTGINMQGLFLQNLAKIYFLELGLGLILGIISSFIAIRRYLKV